MKSILELLRTSCLIQEYQIITLLKGENFFFIKEEALIKDGSTLHLRVFLSKDEYKYSFHWQDKKGNLIARWDNSPHHRVKTFPHHVHREGKVEESYCITLEDVLKEIGNSLKKKEE